MTADLHTWTPEQQDAIHRVQTLRILREIRKHTLPLTTTDAAPTAVTPRLFVVASTLPDQESNP